MVRHPVVRRIGVVGSIETGKAVALDAAQDLKHVTLELGGKNPIIISPDSDPAEAATLAINGMNMNRQGQSCSSTSRVFVHESLHKEVREELVRQVEALPVGLPRRLTAPRRQARQRVLHFADRVRRRYP